MSRRTALVLLVAGAILVVAAVQYGRRDYRPLFSRTAGELVAVVDSTGVGRAIDGKQITEVTLVSDSGLEVRVRVRATGGRTGESFPAVIMIGGLETGRKVVDVPSETDELVVAGIDYPYEGPKRPRGWEWARHFFPMRRAVLRTPSAVLLAAQYLYTREDVDPSRVAVVGVSLGVPFAVSAAATDRRLAGAALLHGGGDISDMAAYAYADRGSPWVVRLLSEALAWVLAPLEPEKYADDIAPRPVLMVNGIDDEFIPRSSVLSLYRAVREPKRLVWIEGRHVAASNDDVVSILMRLTLEWMAEVDLR